MSVHCEVREKTNKMQQLDVYYQHFLNMFWASLCPSSGEQDRVLLHVVCCSGSAGCGWQRLWGAALWGVSTVKVTVRTVFQFMIFQVNRVGQRVSSYVCRDYMYMYTQLINIQCAILYNMYNIYLFTAIIRIIIFTYCICVVTR